MKPREFPPNLVRLSKSFEVFAPRRLRRLARLAEEAGVQNYPSQPQLPDDPVEAARFFGKVGTALADYLRAKSEPRWEWQRKLLKLLSAGTFEAWGIQTKPKVKIGPQQIPSYFFSESSGISWHADKVDKFGRRYEGVQVGRSQPDGAGRVEAPLMGAEIGDENSRPVNDRKKPGPKSGRDAVLRTYEELESRGRFKTAPPTLKAIHRIMQPILAKDTVTFPGGRGLKYRTFLSHFRASKGKS